jgi:uncharacterized protein (TIGR02596 family)
MEQRPMILPAPKRFLAPKSGPAGFSLVELLVVLAVIAILAYFAAPLSSLLQEANSLAFAGQLVGDELAVARQYAASSNQTVYVRFIKPSTSTGITGYGYMQLWRADPANSGNYLPVDRIIKLPTGIEISSKSQLSPLASSANLTTGTMPAGSSVAGNTFYSLTIRPDGNVLEANASTTTAAGNLPNYFFTILPTRYDSNIVLPQNYLTIQVNPDTANTQTYRP